MEQNTKYKLPQSHNEIQVESESAVNKLKQDKAIPKSFF